MREHDIRVTNDQTDHHVQGLDAIAPEQRDTRPWTRHSSFVIRHFVRCLCACILCACIILSIPAATTFAQSSSILNSPHNLSVLGPGEVTADSETQVCIFCHTPHQATSVQPLWNRQQPQETYTVYTSNSLNANPGQPTGSSKLCLSCHDGTIALGSVNSRGQVISMAGGITTLPADRPANLGTDLSDDHPVSFRYDNALATANGRLAMPGALPPSVRLDHEQELQCTSCHDPHNNSFGRFLVMDNSESLLCRTCHTLSDTTVPGHVQCASCHQPHSAPSGPKLLRGETVSQTCLTCHSGSNGGPDIAADLAKFSRHDTDSPVNLIDHVPDNVGCADCHEPHTMHAGSAVAPLISPRLGQVSGVNTSGLAVQQAQYEYEVCFKCHGDQTATQPTVNRQIVQTNRRLQTAPTAISFHPVQTSGSGSSPSLLPGQTSIIYCTSCHASDSSRQAGGPGPDGPHGSTVKPLLAKNYVTGESFNDTTDAALCYSCHDRNSIVGNQSFGKHKEHIVDNGAPCAACHDPHGIAAEQGNPLNNRYLMNFDTAVVSPDPVTQRLEFRDLGPNAGECYLSCHGAAHSPRSYGD